MYEKHTMNNDGYVGQESNKRVVKQLNYDTSSSYSTMSLLSKRPRAAFQKSQRSNESLIPSFD